MNRQLGIDPLKFYNTIRSFKRYISDYIAFSKDFKGKIILTPCLQDWYDVAGDVNSEYFVQDLFIAQQIFESNPIKHVDVGSRIDGFVSNVASFRQIEVFDVREMKNSIKNINFKSADFSDPSFDLINYTESISCLHTLEHFGLGRYGDPVSNDAYINGFNNLANCLKNDGILYLSVPIGKERVEFNANRVFNPLTILNLAKLNQLTIKKLYIIDKKASIVDIDILNNDSWIKLSEDNYNLGVFIFKKNN
jgi:hypothetical protein